MIALVLALALAVALVRPMRGSLIRLKESRFRLEWLIPLGFLVQIAAPWAFGAITHTAPETLARASWLVGNGVLLLTCIANWDRVGFRLVAVGVLANALAITLNGGMPVSVAALEYLGLTSPAEQASALTPLYILESASTRALVLTDVLPVPGVALVRSVVSLGDLFLMVGVVLVVLDSSGALLRPRHAARS